MNRSICRSIPALLALTLTGTLGIAYSQDQPAVNSPLITKTIVLHVNSIAHPGQTLASSPETREIAPPAFTQPPYIVGPVVAPTTTGPESEEHITTDPINSQNLLAMISDFSLNGGFNTSKWAFSKNGGTSSPWQKGFVHSAAGSSGIVTCTGNSGVSSLGRAKVASACVSNAIQRRKSTNTALAE